MDIKNLLEMDMGDASDWLIENQDEYELVKTHKEKTIKAKDEMVEFIELLQQWHENKTGQLKSITENKDAHFDIEGSKVEAGSDIAKGIRFGVALSLHLLGELPFSVTTGYTDSSIKI